MKPESPLNRRGFLKVMYVSGVGMVIQIFLQGCQTEPVPILRPTATPTVPLPAPVVTSQPDVPDWITPNIFVKLGEDGLVTISVARSEMGQGVRTAFPMILADELGADWATIRVEQAPVESIYGEQLTGGSQSIETRYRPLRQAGAMARELLLAAAAEIWGVDKGTCTAENGSVIHPSSGKKSPFKDLIAKASTMPLPSPSEISLREDQGEYRIIGARLGPVDAPQIVTGKAVYGLDVRVPEMSHAVVSRCPTIGGKMVDFDDSRARSLPGVRHVVPIDSGVAVVADDTWTAIRGREILEITWDHGSNNALSSMDLEQSLIEQASRDIMPANNELTAIYIVPYLAHATMEPMNCVADVRSDRCEIWVPSQNPMEVKRKAAAICDLPAESVTVHLPLIGGGFGRRLELGLRGPLPVGTDYAAEAVQISKAIKAPVQVVWTREDDIRHDIYHPLTVIRGWATLTNPPSLSLTRFDVKSPIPTGNWRAVGNVADAFAHESFADEFAAAMGIDPVKLRLSMLPDRAKAVVELAAEKGNWGEALPEGHAAGIAYHSTWGKTHVAQVAEVSVSSEGQVQVHRVVCAVDCGTVINPSIVEAQMTGGIIFGLTTALKNKITIENGQVQQGNFTDYPILRFDEIPKIEVYIVPSDAKPSGIGEMGNPPTAPAIANAIFTVTGKRIRHLPITVEDLR